uniref:Uncharacterized protein n=1 Tax=Tanacetum cinerariifolium TaxID=118510 RepID=A0A6L2MMS3_TANCI|nr:hypothetical protein [Tanacetum cinerariifolium]
MLMVIMAMVETMDVLKRHSWLVIPETMMRKCISAASSKATVSTLLNVDSLSDAVIYSFFASQSNSLQLDNKELKQIDLDDLKEIDLKWQIVMLTMKARRFLKRTRRNLGNADHQGTTGTKKLLEELSCEGSSSSSGSDNNVAPCSKAYATLQTHYDNLTVEFKKSQLDVLSYKTGLESVEARLVVYQKNKTVFEEDIKLLKIDVMLRDNALAKLRKKFKKAEKERNDLKLTLDKFQTSLKNLKLHSHEFDNRVPTNLENDMYKTGEGYHAVLPPYTRTFLPSKTDLVFTDVPNASESVAYVFQVESSANKPSKDISKTHRHDAPIVEDWIYDSEDETEIESVPKQREPSFFTYTEHVKSSRESVKRVEHHLIKDCDYYEKKIE